jgi:hypothetical protein
MDMQKRRDRCPAFSVIVAKYFFTSGGPLGMASDDQSLADSQADTYFPSERTASYDDCSWIAGASCNYELTGSERNSASE